ncbi:MAG: conserved phage C-terminal domain-containing protein [Candidatus Nitrosocosmicus sp.]
MMATGRMVRNQISVSPQVNDLSLKGALLFTWLIPHADDFGRLYANPRRIKAKVVPMRDDITSQDIEECLNEMMEKGLINIYENNEEKFLELTGFDRHQDGLQKRSPSAIPAPSGSRSFSYSEKELENHVSSLIDNSLIDISGTKIVSHERQARVQNCYMDIFCTLADNRKAIIEIKRQRITQSAINQIINYGNMIGGNPELILIGCGIAGNVDIKNCPVILAVFEEDLTIKNINFDEGNGLLFHVNSCQLTSDNVNQQQITLPNVHESYSYAGARGTELNRTEQNRKKNIMSTSSPSSGKPDIENFSENEISDPPPKNSELRSQAKEVLEFLNSKTGKRFRLDSDVNLKLIMARLRSGVTTIQCCKVIAKKTRDWNGDAKMREYLRPATLFGATKFEQYLGELVIISEDSRNVL